MSSNYPEGSMFGSGIYSQEITITMICSNCEYEGEVELMTNDAQTEASGNCSECEHELNKELDEEDFGYDPDLAYEDYRDNQRD
jgi:hypothetical protein